MILYHLYNENNFITHAKYYQEGKQPENAIYIVNCNFIKPFFNGSEVVEGAIEKEIEEANRLNVPKSISRMKFIIQVFITTGIKYEDIVIFIQNLVFDESQKYVILTRLRSATHFDIDSNDLLTIASLMQITEQKLEEIFINGNKLN
jgi:hypothetical protein